MAAPCGLLPRRGLIGPQLNVWTLGSREPRAMTEKARIKRRACSTQLAIERLLSAARAATLLAMAMPAVHAAALARLGFELATFRAPPREAGDPGPWPDFGDWIPRIGGALMLIFGVGTIAIFAAVLRKAIVSGKSPTFLQSFLYCIFLLWVGRLMFLDYGWQTWAWAASSGAAALALIGDASGRILHNWNVRKNLHAEHQPSARRGALLCLGLFMLVAATTLPVRGDGTRHPLARWWTLRRDELDRPNDPVLGYKCKTAGETCSCTQTGSDTDRGTCSDQPCCYRSSYVSFLPDDPEGHFPSECFCVPKDPTTGACPKAFRLSHPRTWRSASCP